MPISSPRARLARLLFDQFFVTDLFKRSIERFLIVAAVVSETES